jgi:hypothetical protein
MRGLEGRYGQRQLLLRAVLSPHRDLASGQSVGHVVHQVLISLVGGFRIDAKEFDLGRDSTASSSTAPALAAARRTAGEPGGARKRVPRPDRKSTGPLSYDSPHKQLASSA